MLSQAVEAVIKADTASKKDEVKSLELTEKAQPSKFAKDLKQLDNGVKVPRHGWKCTHVRAVPMLVFPRVYRPVRSAT